MPPPFESGTLTSMGRDVERLRANIFATLIALGAFAIVWLFASTTLHHANRMGLPLDDSYIYLTYAKQFGRGQPFTYFPGGGYSAGSTSLLWPMLLAPFWSVGARGHALVWVSFLVCGALYLAALIGISRIAQRISGNVPGLVAGLFLLGIGPFAWTALSGMEVAFASVLLVSTLWLLMEQPSTGRPTKRLIACLAALSLSRPEATLLVIVIVVTASIQRLRQRNARSVLWWLTPLVAPAAWLLTNLAFAGQLFPNTGVAKSHFYMPGFDWSFWSATVWTLTKKLLRGMFWDGSSPLVWPRLVAILWLVGAVRVVLWARRMDRRLVAAVILLGPFALMLAVIASSGLWSFHNYRYIAPVLPLLMIPVGCAFGITGEHRQVRRGIAAIAILAAVAFGRAAIPGIVTNAENFAQGAMDTNTQVVTIGEFVHEKLPSASVMFHDAGAIAYYGDGRVYDMLGLVTNYQAGIANHGPGARFEFLESLPPSQRPTHFAYYPSWLGTNEFYGDVLLRTPLHPAIAPNRLVGDADMQVIAANWDHTATGERPITDHVGWQMVDRIDVSHLASERAHGWIGTLGRRSMGDPTARWSFVGREVGLRGLVLDGGRTIRGGGEKFTIAHDPTKPVRLVLRTGGPRNPPYQESIAKRADITILNTDGGVIATQSLEAPAGVFVEVVFDLPIGVERTIQTRCSSAYRVFHWFVLQPE